MAGEPGGVWVFESSRNVVCLTVIVCLKSDGNDIWPGSRFKSWWETLKKKLEHQTKVYLM